MSKTSRHKISTPVLVAIIMCMGSILVAVPGSPNIPFIIDYFNGTPTETPPPSPANSTAWTVTPQTPAPASTDTVAPTFTPIACDFEDNTEGWGDAPENGLPKPGEGVSLDCNTSLPIHYAGSCSLKYQPPQVPKTGNVYVARFAEASDVKSLITIRVYVPAPELCSVKGCSTAKIIIWDNKYQSHESDEFMRLDHVGQWEEITLDLSATNYPQPYQAIGVHFYLVTQYAGPFYIDAVTITHPH